MGKGVILEEGGGMRGVFGWGVLCEIIKLGGKKQIKAVYGTSSSVINVAYFMSEQTDVNIYWEDLQKNFVKPENIFHGFFDRIFNRYIHKIPRRKMYSAINIDKLINVTKTNKRLDVEKLRRSKTEGYAKLYDLEKNRLINKSLKTSSFQTMLEGVSVIPFYMPKKRQRYVDGGVIERISYREIRKRHPKEKIVVILNRGTQRSTIFGVLEYSIEGLISSLMYPGRGLFKKLFKKYWLFREEIEAIKKDKNALLISPPKDNPVDAEDLNPEHLIKSWHMGRKNAKEVLDFIKN